ncbi:MAG TPA: hypothetical protein VF624_10945 [Tepidisphaeraceae bacterium]|jgi:hypothetical protein
MLEYNLTQRERQILVRLIDLSQHSKDHFEARLIDPTAAGPSRELARLDFGGEGHSMDLTKRDLRLLKDEGLIHFRWNLPGLGMGRLSSLAFEAAGSNFHNPPADEAALAAAASKLAIAADERTIATRYSKITGELVELARQLIDADEATAAEHEAVSIANELGKEVPDETVITRKTKGFVSRLSLTFSGTADLAAKGEKIGEFGERLAAWLVALSIWTEWHAAHHAAPDPCA